MDCPCGHYRLWLTLDDVGHESALADEPDASRDVEHAGLDGEEDGDPLVVRVVEARPVVLPTRAHTLEVGRNVERTVCQTMPRDDPMTLSDTAYLIT